ncbi:AAA family ATPase [Epibacterium sp. SM1979]|uniref:AAA family ATPase n=1 Tax=Tritonibacter litoralis TaxID=2662264 RepID=A0A843YI75_9RHOB|nr:TniB family NTP-binding protein [Tritonibacter litoralis]MQQ09508.1 AAA family ATPase [Tritonibacter litoralis]
MSHDQLGTVSDDVAEAIDMLARTHVETPRIRQLSTAFQRLFRADTGIGDRLKPRRFSDGLETHGIAIIGASGSGKTELLHHYFKSHPSLQAAPGEKWSRYLHVTVPSPATLKSLGFECLKLLHYPNVSDRSEKWKIWDLVKFRLSKAEIQVLWIDEAHDLYKPQEREDLLNTLKSLMQGEKAVVVVLSGTEKLSDILKEDRQVGRRFAKIYLPEVTLATDGEQLARLTTAYAQRVGLEASPSEELIQRLIHAARNQFGLSVEIVIGAIEWALLAGKGTLNVQDFAEYWAAQEGCKPDKNVFLVRNWAEIELDERAGEAPVRKRSRRK